MINVISMFNTLTASDMFKILQYLKLSLKNRTKTCDNYDGRKKNYY